VGEDDAVSRGDDERKGEARRRHPVRAAAERGDVPWLIDALADARLRGAAAHQLGELGAADAVPALVRNLRVRNDPDRNMTVKALGRIRDPSAIPALLEVAHEDEAAAVRVTAVDALAVLGDREGRELLTQLAIDPSPALAGSERYFDMPLARFLDRRSVPWTRRWAATRLRQLRAVESLPALEAALPSVGRRHRLRLRRTIRALRAAEQQRGRA
jgi:hypothetical protein